MSILKNALDSIAIGLEDFQSEDERRIISSTRNIFAGILLLFKHRLVELSPNDSDEALIKQRVSPEIDITGAVKWIGKGKKTVDVQNIKERFESLNISVDWKRIERINTYRNDIEHYYSTLKSESVQQLISDSFLIIRNFIVDELNENPKYLLGEEYWNILVEANEVYAKEKAECDSSLEKLDYYNEVILDAFKSGICSSCGSGLLEAVSTKGDAISSNFKCRACDKEDSYENTVNDVLQDYYVNDVYFSFKDGGEAPIVDCPLCFDGTYLVQAGVCATCGDSPTLVCLRCGGTIPDSELSDGDLCGYCDHVVAKVMSE
jgi:hypothetical protein